MKNKIFKSITISFSVSLLLTGCVTDDDLVQANPNFETSVSFWKTDQDAVNGINAVYSALLADGTYMRSTPLLLDVKGDDARSNSPWDAMYNLGRFNSSPSNAAIYGWAFEMYYQGINRANQVLKNVPNIEMTDAALKTRVLGQAYFMRGLYYFHAVNLFKSVPLPTEVTIYSPQKTQAEGWAQVISDLSTAVDMLPVTYVNLPGIDKDQLGRATKGAALGYLAKAYLFNKDYTNAKITFKKLIDLGVYSLMPNYADNFTTDYENNAESIFEIQFSREVGGIENGWGGFPSSTWGKTSARAITYAPRGFGWTDVQPTWVLFDEYHQEMTINNTVDPRLDATMFYNRPGMVLYGKDFATYYASNPADLNDIFCAKYENSKTMPNEFDWRSGINERLMRYSDVLLMYAECLNETGDTQGAYDYVQMVRDRVGLPSLLTTKPGLTQAGMRDQIAHERFLEFPLEGHRFDDIRRWGWLDDPAKLAWLKSRDAEFNTYSVGREYFPIPQLEMDNNPGTVQNPGY